MSNSLQETNVEEIARELKTRRDQGQRTTLFLGSRTGGLYSNENLYDTLKQFSLLNFDTLSNVNKFRECYNVLERFTEKEKHNILVGALSTLRYREEDDLLSSLIKVDLFETIITTNIDNLLEDACDSSGLREPEDYQVVIPGLSNLTEIERNKPQYSSIIKVFGDLNSRRYYPTNETFDLQTEEGLQEFLKPKLSKDILMVGYDPAWDHAIEQIFPLTGGTVWYVSETEPTPRTYLDSLLKQRNGKSLLKSRGSYSSFMRALHNSLEEDIHENQSATVPLLSLPKEPIKDKKKVFIGYNHKDKKYLDRLTTHLKGYLHQIKDTVDIWDDTKILPGSDWKKEIERSLTQAKVVVLLVSTNYLSSFLSTEELPILLDAARNRRVKLLPIILDPSLSLFSDDEPLNNYQAVNSSSKPLTWMKPYEQEVVWNKLAEQVYSILHSQD